ncbi:hypothetical protein H6G76_22785 [Nostoc sp. FACHB-152]|uniref:hypothetical protein n=1 Tax=unclassified Nostoc TaxID=2593658 RepID=UPI0016890294|nr:MULTISPECIES: hypothetical protein [unclassified Nostoc]MBD2449937.1 hypothetical protein [Nostoc sp. FACHB-152]MBD2468471.1 hypothetical protein [Nostoc sp. FACHB-145]
MRIKTFLSLSTQGTRVLLHRRDRISAIYSDSLEETVKNRLQSLGKLNRPYLTAVEEKLLGVLELKIRY